MSDPNSTFHPDEDDLPGTESIGPGDVPEQSRRVGKFKLLKRIGVGGMGEIWLAEQDKPVRRRVALKMIKAGWDSKSTLARFETERQALALMDHPSIARIFDAGETSDGRPYFAMEYVQGGKPINAYCVDEKLGLSQRLELFASVCNAVHHAHQKGIIHRDLKPSNILVHKVDGKASVKVIDFGVAKSLQGNSLTDRTLFTEFGPVGTLLYMSPEQADLSSDDVDTRSDIYSLGVVLYELLAGSTPIELEELRKKAHLNSLLHIREYEPPSPSQRLSSDEHNLKTLSEIESVHPPKFLAMLRGEMDWVVMKTLEKDRERRYDSVAALRDDVFRYLHQEPVTARPASYLYMLRKHAAKHYRLVLTTSSLFVLLFLVASVVSWLAWKWKEESDGKQLVVDELANTNLKLEAEVTRAQAATEAAVWNKYLRLAREGASFKRQGKDDKCRESFLATPVKYRGIEFDYATKPLNHPVLSGDIVAIDYYEPTGELVTVTKEYLAFRDFGEITKVNRIIPVPSGIDVEEIHCAGKRILLEYTYFNERASKTDHVLVEIDVQTGTKVEATTIKVKEFSPLANIYEDDRSKELVWDWSDKSVRIADERRVTRASNRESVLKYDIMYRSFGSRMPDFGDQPPPHGEAEIACSIPIGDSHLVYMTRNVLYMWDDKGRHGQLLHDFGMKTRTFTVPGASGMELVRGIHQVLFKDNWLLILDLEGRVHKLLIDSKNFASNRQFSEGRQVFGLERSRIVLQLDQNDVLEIGSKRVGVSSESLDEGNRLLEIGEIDDSPSCVIELDSSLEAVAFEFLEGQDYVVCPLPDRPRVAASAPTSSEVAVWNTHTGEEVFEAQVLDALVYGRYLVVLHQPEEDKISRTVDFIEFQHGSPHRLASLEFDYGNDRLAGLGEITMSSSGQFACVQFKETDEGNRVTTLNRAMIFDLESLTTQMDFPYGTVTSAAFIGDILCLKRHPENDSNIDSTQDTLEVYDAKNGLATLASGLDFYGDYFDGQSIGSKAVIGCHTGRVIFVDANSKKVISFPQVHSALTVAWMLDVNEAVTYANDQMIFWDLSRFAETGTVKQTSRFRYPVDYEGYAATDKPYFVEENNSRLVHHGVVWDASSKSPVADFGVPFEAVAPVDARVWQRITPDLLLGDAHQLSFDEASQRIFVVSSNMIECWEAESGDHAFNLQLSGKVQDFFIVPGGESIVIADDATVSWWDLKTREAIFELEIAGEGVPAFFGSENGDSFYLRRGDACWQVSLDAEPSEKRSIELLPVSDEQLSEWMLKSTDDGSSPSTACSSFSGQLTATSEDRSTVVVTDQSQGDTKRLQFDVPIKAIALSGDGRYLAVFDFNHRFAVYDLENASLLHEITDAFPGIRGMALSDRGQKLAYIGNDGTLGIVRFDLMKVGH